ncbi:hypothetical protein CF111_04410 [Aeromonas sobria]|uniref:hypothetical protein n=1 Tax=Aeromonas sobria TaxID=646 RepID=UPI00111BC226|nr:hypothetical protein [Aeromonas sobria]TNJ25287.1 hypothetical protein CF111_04410 [Aeromonas sobria]
MKDNDAKSQSKSINLKSAHELREQMQEKNSDEIFIEDGFNEKFIAHLKDIFKFASEDEINSVMKMCIIPQLYTKYDSPLTYSLINTYESIVLDSLKILNYDLLDGVSIGVIKKDDLTAEQTKVIMTNASVINISENLLLTINRYSKLLAKSLAINIVGKDSFVIDRNIQRCIDENLRDKQLQYEWDMFFADHALSLNTPYKGAAIDLKSYEELSLFDALSTSMTIFVLGHEYGHHVMKHSYNGEVCTASHREDEYRIDEYEADRVAFEISTASSTLELNGDIKFFLYANIGALLVFTMFDYIKMAHSILDKGSISYDVNIEGSHPSGPNRYNEFIRFITSEYRLEDIPHIRDFHGFITSLTDHIWSNSQNHIMKMYEHGFRPKDNENGWLP